GGDEAARLMEREQPRPLGGAQRLAVDADVIVGADVEGRARQRFAIDADAAFLDPGFGVAPRAQPGAGDHFGDAFAGTGFGFVAFGFVHDCYDFAFRLP